MRSLPRRAPAEDRSPQILQTTGLPPAIFGVASVRLRARARRRKLMYRPDARFRWPGIAEAEPQLDRHLRYVHASAAGTQEHPTHTTDRLWQAKSPKSI